VTSEARAATAPLAAFVGIRAEAIWLRPVGLLRGAAAMSAVAAADALPLLGGDVACSALEILAIDRDQVRVGFGSLAELRRWAATQEKEVADRIEELLAALSVPPPPWAGLPLDRPRIMGVVNVTPDSFSDGGELLDPAHAIEAGKAMLAAGADIIDVGGESTRPGAAPLSPEDETRRVEPVIAALAEAGAIVSIDTRHAAVMAAALAKGARIVNDVTALTHDPDALPLVAKRGAAIVLMHMKGEPRTMQQDPVYACAPIEVAAYLAGRIAACAAAGIPRERIIVDPGIGFGKNLAHNLEIIERLTLFHALGCGVLLGVSRKSFIGRVTGVADPKARLPGSLAAALYGVSLGVQIVRVHDVAATHQALAVWQAIVQSS
jgi:dihydropteroate synthase